MSSSRQNIYDSDNDSCSIPVELGVEARANINSPYQNLRRHSKLNWSKNKYIIYGVLIAAVLMAGCISFIIVYSQNQNLAMELNRYQEIAELENHPYSNSKDGTVVVEEPSRDKDNNGRNHDQYDHDPVVINNGNTTVTNTSSDTNGEDKSKIPDREHHHPSNENAISFWHEKKGATVNYIIEECKEKKAQLGFKCTMSVVLEQTLPPPGRNFTGYGVGKKAAKKTAGESAALALFNVTFATTESDMAVMKRVQALCEKSTLI